jgi:hypothetical protein
MASEEQMTRIEFDGAAAPPPTASRPRVGKKRRAFLFLLLVVFVIATALAIGFLVTHDSVSQANYERIQIGMSKEQVEAILGKPSGSKLVAQLGDAVDVIRWEGQQWDGQRVLVWVYFDRNGRVCEKMRSRHAPMGWWGDILRWLRLAPDQVQA